MREAAEALDASRSAVASPPPPPRRLAADLLGYIPPYEGAHTNEWLTLRSGHKLCHGAVQRVGQVVRLVGDCGALLGEWARRGRAAHTRTEGSPSAAPRPPTNGLL